MPQASTWWIGLIFLGPVSTFHLATANKSHQHEGENPLDLIPLKLLVISIISTLLWLPLQLICLRWTRQWDISALKNIKSRLIRRSEFLEMPRIKPGAAWFLSINATSEHCPNITKCKLFTDNFFSCRTFCRKYLWSFAIDFDYFKILYQGEVFPYLSRRHWLH